MDQLVYVKLKHNLLNMDLEKQLIEVIDQRIRTLPNYQELRLNPELVLLTCNLVENAVIDKHIKIDKKSLCLRVLTSIFTYTEADKKQVSETIEFLHCNKRIKKVSIFRKCILIVWDWVCRKFL
jgi:hypothetical protein